MHYNWFHYKLESAAVSFYTLFLSAFLINVQCACSKWLSIIIPHAHKLLIRLHNLASCHFQLSPALDFLVIFRRMFSYATFLFRTRYLKEVKSAIGRILITSKILNHLHTHFPIILCFDVFLAFLVKRCDLVLTFLKAYGMDLIRMCSCKKFHCFFHKLLILQLICVLICTFNLSFSRLFYIFTTKLF